MKNNGIYIGIVIVLTIFALQFWDSAPKLLNTPESVSTQYKKFPYAMIENAHSKHFDQQGLLSYEFIAKKLRHFRSSLDTISADDYTLMDTLQVTLHTEDSQWFVSADEGTITDAGNTLTLQSNVRIWQPMKSDGITELTTTQLVLHPNQKIVTTEEPVKISAPQGQINAVGMTVDLNTKNIQLKNNVRGYHEPI